ncbi:MAG TPA: hypothetical protein VGD79_07125, partial [Thermoanaerobaculia bacterium]
MSEELEKSEGVILSREDGEGSSASNEEGDPSPSSGLRMTRAPGESPAAHDAGDPALTRGMTRGVILSREDGEGSSASNEGMTQGEPDAPEDSSAYKVTLPSFHGPLDLLLHLIRKHE